MKEREIKIEVKTKTEMALDYKVDARTFRKWIKPFQEEIGEYVGIYTPKQVGIIYDKLGRPF